METPYVPVVWLRPAHRTRPRSGPRAGACSGAGRVVARRILLNLAPNLTLIGLMLIALALSDLRVPFSPW